MKRRWRVLAVALGALALWTGGPWVGRRIDFFRVRRIEFVGMRFLSPESTAAALRLGPAASVFDDLAPVARRALSVPGVLRADVSRRLPGTVVVTIRERQPVALTPKGTALVLMDSLGRTLPYDPTRSAPDLPVAARPDARVGRLLGRVQRLSPALFARVASAERLDDDVLLVVDGRRVLFRPDASVGEMRAVMAVAQDLARKGQAYSELDGRFAGYVIVRGSGA